MSATQTIKFSVQSNARAYSNIVAQYADETGKSISAALMREGRDFASELFRQFLAIRPNPQLIHDAAKARHFRMGRKGNNFVAAIDGLSVKARNAAYNAMGGDTSDYFNKLGSKYAYFIVPARFSARRNHKLLIGGHVGRKIAKSALRASQLTPEERKAALSKKIHIHGSVEPITVENCLSRLNRRAVATYFEIVFRQRGAHGFMASQWLYKEWKKVQHTDPDTGIEYSKRELVSKAGNGKPTGKVKFETDLFGRVQNILLTGMIPGTAEEMQKHGILPKVATERLAALASAIKQHHEKVARKHGLN